MQRTVLAIALSLFAVAATAADDWDNLVQGNARYVEGHLVYSHLDSIRRATRDKQKPPVTVVTCADSRVPPELIFDQTVGDLFVVRVAGNVIDDFNLASVEYAVSQGYTKLIVVMGHESCGAVDAAISGGTDFGSPALNALVKKIRTNLDQRKPPIRQAIEMNARASTKEIRASKIVQDNKIPVVTVYYSFDGKVTRLSENGGD